MNAAELARTSAHLDDARCADLVLGLLPETERAAALDHAHVCEACETRLRAHVRAGARARADLAAQANPARLPAQGVRAGNRWRVMAAAAAVLALAVALPLVLRRAPEAVPERWLPAVDERVLTREGEREDPRLAAGLEAYREHDLALAARELSAAQASGATERMRRLYLAHVRLAGGDAPGALELLRGLEWREIPEPWRRDGVALLARALRRTGHATAADSIDRTLRTQDPAAPVVP